MTWAYRFELRQRLRGSLWVLPLVGAIVGAVLGELSWLDDSIDLPANWRYPPSTATALLAAIVGAMAALTGFVLTVSVLVVQMAASTFSARYLRLWYRDRLLKVLLAVLVGTLTFSFGLMRRVESDFVPNIGVTVAGLLVVVSLILFLLFLDRFLHRLRPVAVAALVADLGRRAFEDMVRAASHPEAPRSLTESALPDDEPTAVVRNGRAGAIQAIDAAGFSRFARTNGCLLVLPHLIGDFVPTGATLVEVYGGTVDPNTAERELRGLVALGVERTIEQDPAFAIRVLVDIAVKALSPAINDPTTAVQVLNHLGDTLRLIGTTDLGRTSAEPPSGVLMPMRRWEDFLALGVTEIREYGAKSVQVTRRLRALLEELHDAVLPDHRPPVDDELLRLDASVELGFSGSPDLDRAGAADHQGIGGSGALTNRTPAARRR